jgi:hypothetical protein
MLLLVMLTPPATAGVVSGRVVNKTPGGVEVLLGGEMAPRSRRRVRRAPTGRGASNSEGFLAVPTSGIG